MTALCRTTGRNAIRALVLDIDGTLYRQSPVRRFMAMRLLRLTMTHPREGWRTLSTIRAYRAAQEYMRTSAGENIASRQVELAAQRTGRPRQQIEDTVWRWMETEPLQAVRRARFPGVIEFCRWAESVKLPLAVLSDYPAVAKLQALELASYISVVVSAQDADVNCFKPNPRGLLKAVRQLGAQTSEVVYVGDRAEVDLPAASTAGVQAVLFGAAPRRLDGAVTLPTWLAIQAWVAERI